MSLSSEKRVMKTVLNCIHVGRRLPVLNPSYHFAAGSRRREEKNAFFLKRYLAASPASFGCDPNEKSNLFSTVRRNDLTSWSGSFPENLSKARSGKETAFWAILRIVIVWFLLWLKFSQLRYRWIVFCNGVFDSKIESECTKTSDRGDEHKKNPSNEQTVRVFRSYHKFHKMGFCLTGRTSLWSALVDLLRFLMHALCAGEFYVRVWSRKEI